MSGGAEVPVRATVQQLALTRERAKLLQRIDNVEVSSRQTLAEQPIGLLEVHSRGVQVETVREPKKFRRVHLIRR